MEVMTVEVALQEIRSLVGLRRFAEAQRHCTALVERSPGDSRAWDLLAQIQLGTSRAAAAADSWQRAAACAPDDARLLLHFALRLLQVGQREAALALVSRVERLAPTDAQSLDSLGSLLTHAEEPARALPYFQRAVASAPGEVRFRYNLAMAERMLGLLDAAEADLDIVIAARPDDTEAHLARSGLRTQTRDRNHVEQLQAALERLQGRRASTPAGFALAKELEDLGEHSRSFAVLSAVSRAHRAALRYDVGDDVAVLERLRSSHTRSWLNELTAGFRTDECIFIIGLPRSGTTLVDRIVASHSQVSSAGELDAFPRVAVAAVSKQAGRRLNKLEFVDYARKLDFQELGRSYLEATRPRTGHSRKFTDKLPLNYLYAGLIHAALPAARFIALDRHPLDVCYAMYKTLFAAAYPFTYDLMDLARYYLAWNRLMAHWQDLLGDAWLRVSYEELVRAPEAVSRRIIAHCNLAWETDCLDFHAQPGAVTTASAAQVRRPVYPDSIGRWRAYSTELKPLRHYLEANGIAVRDDASSITRA